SISQDQLLYHLTLSTRPTDLLTQGLILESSYIRGTALGPSHGQRLKILEDSAHQGWRVGKAKLLSDPNLINRKAKNGILHAVDNLFDPPPLLSDLVASLPLDQGGDFPLSTPTPSLIRLLSGPSKYANVLDNITHPHSLLLPSPKNLSLLFNDIEWAYLEHGLGREDADSLLGHHLLPTDIYLGALGSGENMTMSSEGGTSLNFHRSHNQSSLIVDGRPIASVDLLAANGVLHLLDTPLYPPSLLFTPAKLLYGLGADKLAQSLLNATNSSDLVKWVTGKKGQGSKILLAPADRWLDPDNPEGTRGHWNPKEDKGMALLSGTEEDGTILVPTLLSSSRTLGTPQPVKIILKAGRVTQVQGALGPIGIVGSPVRVRPRAGLDPSMHLDDDEGEEKEEDTLIPVNGLLPPPPPLLHWNTEEHGQGKKYIKAALSAGMDELLNKTDGITLFLPSDDALTSIGIPTLTNGPSDQSLLFDYLTLPMAKAKMSWVTRALVVPNRTLYTYDFPYRHANGSGAMQLLAQSGETIWVSRGPEGKESRGLEVSLVDPTTLSLPSFNQVEDVPSLGRVKEGDIAVERGSVHVIHQLLLPPTLPITPRDLLHGAGATIFLAALDHLGLQSLLESTWPIYTFLAPSDQAFEGTNVTELFQDTWKLRRLVLGHILLGVPHWGGGEMSSPPTTKEDEGVKPGRELESLLGKGKVLKFSKDWAKIGLKRGAEWARILRLARSHPSGIQSKEGAHMVLKVDRVLDEVWAGLFWSWPLILGLVLLILLILGGSIFGGWKGYKIYQRRRGYDELRV
ncbi:hypothetical protein BJ684DRAFT_19515, partial [Piptocephalis cylindrospora]